MNDSRLPERFWSKVSESTNGCWIWTGAHTADGYGNIKVGGKATKAHRMAYEALVGPISNGLDIDHLCRVRECVNPSHLEPVTRQENILRGVSYCAQQAAKTHCKKGHEFDQANTYVTGRGNRACRACLAAAQRKYYRRRKQLQVAA